MGKQPSRPRVRALPIALAAAGTPLVLGCTVALYWSVLVIDERMIDPGDSSGPLWAGAALGLLLIVAACGLWAAGGLRRRQR